jgi:chaperonin cofactor prefoldin
MQAEAGEPRSLEERIQDCPGRLDRLSIRVRTLSHQVEDLKEIVETQRVTIEAMQHELDHHREVIAQASQPAKAESYAEWTSKHGSW